MAFKKGQIANPNGRPKAPEKEELRKALKLAKLKYSKSFIQHFVEKAYIDKDYAIALARKILPDKLENDLFMQAFLHEENQDKTPQQIIKEAEELATKLIGDRTKISQN